MPSSFGGWPEVPSVGDPTGFGEFKLFYPTSSTAGYGPATVYSESAILLGDIDM